MRGPDMADQDQAHPQAVLGSIETQGIDAIHAGSFSLAIDPANFSIVFTRPIFELGPVGLTGKITMIPATAVAMLPQLAKNLVSESESEWLYYIVDTLCKGQANLLIR